ncbi:MAG TPA: histidine kinase [Salinarimonas sp.]|jgi:DNA-binding response OmpR family regulator|nr:histidine kinase [Salinarimonas sp.]
MNDSSPPRPVILLAEDEAVIALELAESLERDGYAVAGPFATCAAAEAWLKENEPSGAILDNALRDGPCEALAGDLGARGIPFLVYSGHGRTSDAPPAFQNVAWIVKPVPTESLLRAIRAALA